MFQGGYMGKLLRVNLSTRSILDGNDCSRRVSPLFGRARAGRGLVLAGNRSPRSSRWTPENKLAFFTGPMTGTPLVSTTKFELTTKGPETGHYLCSNSSGNFRPAIARGRL